MKTFEPPKRFKVEVTQEDIEKGKPGDCEKCAVARAIKRQFARKKVMVCSDDSAITIEDTIYYYTHPLKTTKFIEKFDELKGEDRKRLKPFSFVAIRELPGVEINPED